MAEPDFHAILEGLNDHQDRVQIREQVERDDFLNGHPHGHTWQVRAAKARARRLGLRYWPALLDAENCDPKALLVAERILRRRTGAYYGDELPDGSRSYGGWDSAGNRGLSGRQVVAMWRAAGCRDSRKFRVQVGVGRAALKSETIPAFLDRVRGERWADKTGLDRDFILPRKVLRVLGRLSPEARYAALRGLSVTRPRIRDLNWSAVSELMERRRDPSPRALALRALALPPRPAAWVLGVKPDLSHPIRETGVALRLSPAFPCLPRHLAERVHAGESPKAIAESLGVDLTKKEAHAWAKAGGNEHFLDWLAGYHDLPRDRMGNSQTRSLHVLRWLQHLKESGRWSAAENERTVAVEGQGVRRYSLLDVLDEIQDEDIHTGRDSVGRVLDRAAERSGSAWLSRALRDTAELATPPAWADRLPRGARLLNTAAALAREGNEMSHCVGGYRNAVARGQAFILSLRSRHGRSTVELRPNGSIAQHHREHDHRPPRRHQALLDAWLRRYRHHFTPSEDRHVA